MCGIAAIINPTIKGINEMDFMLKKIEHRGDSEPKKVEFGNCILGNVRLKIVDRPNGTQPFYNEDKTVCVIFNGEIYNYKKLKAHLEVTGHHFNSDCDTEVLVHLYEDKGINFIHELEGMFSFLIYDSIENKFFGVRDFFGVKPFFYCRRGKTIYIASEMKSFIDLNVELFEELNPGHYITNDGIHKYYNISSSGWCTESPAGIAIKVKKLLESAVEKRVQTDLPIAVFLGGGIDSSIVCLLCNKFHKNITALIIGEDSSEDVVYSKRLCNDFNLKYHHLKLNKQKLLNNISDIIFAIESFEPNVVRGSLLSMKLSEIAQALEFKIVLCGEGSDEIFAGYGDFLFIDDKKEFQNEILNFLNDLYRTQLLRVDRTGMKYAVEIREPFLDRALVEYVLTIHPNYKVAIDNRGERTTKFILREAFKDMLPDYILYRQKMTLMNGAGIGSVARNQGILYEFAEAQLDNKEFEIIKNNFSDYKILDKEEAFCLSKFFKDYSKAKFAQKRVRNAQHEILVSK